MPMQIELFEALTEAGIKPEAARKIERQVEMAIRAGHGSLRSEVGQKTAIKADIAELKVDLRKMIIVQMWRLVIFGMLAATLSQVLVNFLV